MQGVVVGDTWLGCYSHRFTLDSGVTVDLDVGDGQCETGPKPTLTAFLPTTNFASGPGLGLGAYVFIGHYGDGRLWYFTGGRAGPGIDGCLYFIGAGAFDEGATFHLSNGLVLPKATNFRYTWSERVTPEERTTNGPKGETCVNAKGEVDLIQYIPTAGQ